MFFPKNRCFFGCFFETPVLKCGVFLPPKTPQNTRNIRFFLSLAVHWHSIVSCSHIAAETRHSDHMGDYSKDYIYSRIHAVHAPLGVVACANVSLTPEPRQPTPSAAAWDRKSLPMQSTQCTRRLTLLYPNMQMSNSYLSLGSQPRETMR
eukprot:SAG31_NODE_7620_length_1637_cov_45.855007_1_plen_150_part_00